MKRDTQLARAFTGPTDPFYRLFLVPRGSGKTKPCPACGRKLGVTDGVALNCCCTRDAFFAGHRDGETEAEFMTRMSTEEKWHNLPFKTGQVGSGSWSSTSLLHECEPDGNLGRDRTW